MGILTAARQVWVSVSTEQPRPLLCSLGLPGLRAVPILCSLAWAAGSWSLLFLHKQEDEKLLKETKAAGSQEPPVFPPFQELGL